MVEHSSRSTAESTRAAEHVEDEATFDRLLADEERLLVDFYADWYGPCQMMAPIVDELAAETDVPVVKVDVEALPHIATRYNVNSIPTFILLKHGSLERRLVGMQEKETLAELL